MKPTISVVVCTKNEEARLETIVANHPDEIIVVDGGSTDRKKFRGYGRGDGQFCSKNPKTVARGG